MTYLATWSEITWQMDRFPTQWFSPWIELYLKPFTSSLLSWEPIHSFFYKSLVEMDFCHLQEKKFQIICLSTAALGTGFRIRTRFNSSKAISRETAVCLGFFNYAG